MKSSKNNRPLSSLSRRRVLQGTAGAAVVLMTPAVLRPARAQGVTCRIATSEAIGSPISETFEAWAATLREQSDGAIDAQHFPASQLGSYSDLIEGNRLGTIEITTGGPDTEESIAPEIAATGGAPGFIYRDEAHVDAVLQGPIGTQVSQIAREKTGVEFVAFGEVGFRHLLTKEPVTNLEELAGTKIRVPELRVWIDFWQLLGANPTPLPYAEQYNALSTGVIEGLEADFFSINGFNWYEQAPHLTLTNHWFLPKAVRVNAGWLDGLDPGLQDMVRSTALEAFAGQREANRTGMAAALDGLVAAGVTVHELSDEEKVLWVETASPLFEQFGSVNEETAAMIAAIRAL
jgi:TRAP-type C4-dicarboxylate transport system substrate-binding protein